MKYSYRHIDTFLFFNSPSKLSSRESSNLVGRLKNVLESVDALEAILATCAIGKKDLNLWSLWSKILGEIIIYVHIYI